MKNRRKRGGRKRKTQKGRNKAPQKRIYKKASDKDRKRNKQFRGKWQPKEQILWKKKDTIKTYGKGGKKR